MARITLRHNNMPSPVAEVFGIAELVEIILLDNAVTLKKLFVLQRINRTFKGIIEGSTKLQRKIFLLHGSAQPKIPELGPTAMPAASPPFWSPLVGAIPAWNTRSSYVHYINHHNARRQSREEGREVEVDGVVVDASNELDRFWVLHFVASPRRMECRLPEHFAELN